MAIILLFLVSAAAKVLASIPKLNSPGTFVAGRLNQSLKLSAVVLTGSSSIFKAIAVAPSPERVLTKLPVTPVTNVSLAVLGIKAKMPFTGVPVLSTTSMCVILELKPPKPFMVKAPSVTCTIIVATLVSVLLGRKAGIIV